jgi:hypothetical protein
MWNPLQSERAMFRFLIQVGAFCAVVVVIVLVAKAIF